jgi:shikimate dehydrogenase
LIGENTLGQAVLDCIRALDDPQAKRVVLLGVGNGERAIALELAKAGAASVTLLHLTDEPLDENAASLVQASSRPIQLVEWSEHFSLEGTDILIDVAGTKSSKTEHRSKLNLAALPSRAIVADLKFNPPDSELLRKARTRGCRTIDGLQVLVSQLAANFQLWTGARPDTVVMREALEEFLEF